MRLSEDLPEKFYVVGKNPYVLIAEGKSRQREFPVFSTQIL